MAAASAFVASIVSSGARPPRQPGWQESRDVAKQEATKKKSARPECGGGGADGGDGWMGGLGGGGVP